MTCRHLKHTVSKRKGSFPPSYVPPILFCFWQGDQLVPHLLRLETWASHRFLIALQFLTQSLTRFCQQLLRNRSQFCSLLSIPTAAASGQILTTAFLPSFIFINGPFTDSEEVYQNYPSSSCSWWKHFRKYRKTKRTKERKKEKSRFTTQITFLLKL